MPSSDGPAPPVVINVPSEIEYANAAEVRDQLAAALASSPPALIIDLTHTTFCDSADVAALAYGHRLAGIQGTRIHLVIPAGQLIRLFAIYGLDGTWNLYPTLDAARIAATPAPGDPASAS